MFATVYTSSYDHEIGQALGGKHIRPVNLILTTRYVTWRKVDWTSRAKRASYGRYRYRVRNTKVYCGQYELGGIRGRPLKLEKTTYSAKKLNKGEKFQHVVVRSCEDSHCCYFCFC